MITKEKILIRTDDEGYPYNVGQKARITKCHKSLVTFSDDGSLCCKVCWKEVSHDLLSPPMVDGKWFR